MRAARSRRPAARSARRTNPDELDVPLDQLAQGWYLVYWRVISVDGHPVRGAFTFAVGPNPGPAPQFVIPSISETAATPAPGHRPLVVFLSAMVAIGLFVFRIVIARPLRRRVPGSSLRAVTVAFAVSLGVALVATPVYLLMATAKFALRHDLGHRRAGPADARLGVRSRLSRPRARPALFAVAAAVRSGSSARSARSARSPSCSPLTGALLAAGVRCS